MNFKIPITVWSVLAVLLCFNTAPAMANDDDYDDYYYIQNWQWCCMEEVSQTEECPPEETMTTPPPQLEKPEPMVSEPIPEPAMPEPVAAPVETVSMPEEPAVVEVIETEEVVVAEPAFTPEPAREKPLPATASNWATDLLVGFSMMALAFGIRRRWAV